MATSKMMLRAELSVTQALEELNRLAVEFPERALCFCEGLHGLQKAGVFLKVYAVPAAGTGRMTLTLEPCERFLEFVAAAGAGDFDVELFRERFHEAFLRDGV